MAYRDAAVTDFLGGFFSGLLIVLVTTVCFAGYVVWHGQSVQPSGAPAEAGVSDDQQGAGELRAVEEAPPQQ
ncbi:hypothetical protein VE25_10375 [Devosia geojensis]|uniref:Uncharacterized protein n=1 Tax=Devosia geojensis TaxID=443610 RepID=A0A0F5FSL1_9HYPH|nr:hypothetical protein [Devosia geojensis]KKB11861.1 hypothetical protein VE25_10375 [Devosia geojensis]